MPSYPWQRYSPDPQFQDFVHVTSFIAGKSKCQGGYKWGVIQMLRAAASLKYPNLGSAIETPKCWLRSLRPPPGVMLVVENMLSQHIAAVLNIVFGFL